MIPQIATILFVLAIAGLFALDREVKDPASRALWIPVYWLWIGGSRNVSEWLQMRGPAQGARYLEGNPVDRAILTVVMALGVIVLLGRQRQVGELLGKNKAVLLYFFYCGVSCLWSDYPDVALKRWFRGVGDVVMVLVILTSPSWLSALKQVLKRVAFVLLPLSVLLIRFFPSLGRSYSYSGVPMWSGVSDDKNGLGMLCLIFGLGAVWRLNELYKHRDGERRRKRLIASGIIVALTLYLLWEADSVTSISCFGMAVGLMMVTGRWRVARIPAVAAFLAAAAVGVSAYVLFSGSGGGVLQTMGRKPDLTGRTEVWQTVLPFVQSPIFGSGYESFWLGDRLIKIGNLTSQGIQEAHNGYLEIYLNLGWAGLTMLALVILTGYRRVVLAVRQDPTAGKLRLAYFVLALIYNFTEAAFKMQSPVWIFFLLSVMALPSVALLEGSLSPTTENVRDFTTPERQVAPALTFGVTSKPC
jgi:exopolysaccharide production protein ExoQ